MREVSTKASLTGDEEGVLEGEGRTTPEGRLDWEAIKEGVVLGVLAGVILGV